MNNISGSTDLYAVIGKPIKHTLSPKIYNHCFKELGIDAVYLAFSCDESEVRSTLEAVKRLNIKGINCTMPCKRPVSELVDKVSGAAIYAKAVNTVVNNNGYLTGYITDGQGAVLDLKDHGIDIKNKHILQLGVGGAGCAILIQCALDGAKSIHIANRGIDNLNFAKNIAKQMKNDGVSCDFSFSTLMDEDEQADQEEFIKAAEKADIIVNTTPLGMAPNNIDKSPISEKLLKKNHCIYDVIYNPIETKLIKNAKKVGCESVFGGKGMLMWQAVAAFKLYTGLDAPVESLKKILL